MGAKADIDKALGITYPATGGPIPRFSKIVLGPSAARAFLADLYHEGVIPVPPDGEPRLLPKSYRGFNIDTTEEFDGWAIEPTK